MEPGQIDLMRDPQRMGPQIVRGLEQMIGELTAHGKMYEIGSFAGESAVIFARRFAEVHCVDPWNDFMMYGIMDPAMIEREFERRTRRFSNIYKYKDTSQAAARVVPDETLDFVYIDGDHSFYHVTNDLTLWWPKVKKGAAIGGHDYLPLNVQWSKVATALEFWLDGHLLPKVYPDTSWVVWKDEQGRPVV